MQSRTVKDEINEEFADVDFDDLRNEYENDISVGFEDFQEELKSIKVGQIDSSFLDDISVFKYLK